MLAVILTSFIGGLTGLFFWVCQKRLEESEMLAREIRQGIAELVAALHDTGAKTPCTARSRALAAGIDSAVGAYVSRLPFWRRGMGRDLAAAWHVFYSQFSAKFFIPLYEVPDQQEQYAAFCEGQLSAVLNALKK